MAVDEILAKAECQDLLYRFGSALDRAAHDEAADMFAPDGVAVRPDGESISGAAVREMLLNRPTDIVTRHFLSNVSVTATGDDAVEAFAYVLVYRVPLPEGGTLPLPIPDTPQGVGDWRVQFRRATDGWRISRWQATPTFAP
jgi:SnoaL-like domain